MYCRIILGSPRSLQCSMRPFGRFQMEQGPTLHYDKGWQYHMAAYHETMLQKGIGKAYQGKELSGQCGDENFFGHLKSELLYYHVLH